jgi:hypothetical protein
MRPDGRSPSGGWGSDGREPSRVGPVDQCLRDARPERPGVSAGHDGRPAATLPINGLMRMTAGSLGQGTVEFRCLPDESAYNPIGLVHGALVCTLPDSVAGLRRDATMPSGFCYPIPATGRRSASVSEGTRGPCSGSRPTSDVPGRGGVCRPVDAQDAGDTDARGPGEQVRAALQPLAEIHQGIQGAGNGRARSRVSRNAPVGTPTTSSSACRDARSMSAVARSRAGSRARQVGRVRSAAALPLAGHLGIACPEQHLVVTAARSAATAVPTIRPRARGPSSRPS